MNLLTGYLVRTRRKISERSPDWIGGLKIENGEEYDLAGWDKISQKGGNKYITIRAIPKSEKERIKQKKNPYEGMDDVG
jgi:hypothetical protein